MSKDWRRVGGLGLVRWDTGTGATPSSMAASHGPLHDEVHLIYCSVATRSQRSGHIGVYDIPHLFLVNEREVSENHTVVLGDSLQNLPSFVGLAVGQQPPWRLEDEREAAHDGGWRYGSVEGQPPPAVAVTEHGPCDYSDEDGSKCPGELDIHEKSARIIAVEMRGTRV